MHARPYLAYKTLLFHKTSDITTFSAFDVVTREASALLEALVCFVIRLLGLDTKIGYQRTWMAFQDE